MARMILNYGRLRWPDEESATRRYGTVDLWSPGRPYMRNYIPEILSVEGTLGTLIAVRNSGEETVLGVGCIFFDSGCVGLKPEDGRKTEWLHVSALNTLYNALVWLYFEPLELSEADHS